MADGRSLVTLATWLAGEFDNQAQAQDQPIWFVHLRLWHRPLPHRLDGNIALFAEQANALYLHQPYRQRIIVLKETQPHQGLEAHYLALKHPNQFSGAGANPEPLHHLHWDDVETLPGCVLHICDQGNAYQGQPEPEAKCQFQYEGKIRQVILGFDVTVSQFSSFDRGVDPDTGQGLWGALMGAYEFTKQQDFSGELPLQGS